MSSLPRYGFVVLLLVSLAACASRGTVPHPDLGLPLCAGVEEGTVGFIVGPTRNEAELRAALVESGAGDVAARAVFIPGDSLAPRQVNGDVLRFGIERGIRRSTVRSRDGGIAPDTVEVALRVEPDGRVGSAHLARESADGEMNKAILEAGRALRYSPPVHGGCRLPVWIQFNVDWG